MVVSFSNKPSVAGPTQTEQKVPADQAAPAQGRPFRKPESDHPAIFNHPSSNKPTLWRLINFIKRNRGIYRIAKALRSIKRNGVKEIPRVIAANKRVRLSSLKAETRLAKFERLAQEKTVFPMQIKISIVTPLRNTPERFLRETIESVMAQTYSNWELCLTDGSDSEHEDVENICSYYAQKDSRIKYKKLKKNPCISTVLNKAIELSTGEFIGILDHDDLLHPSALYETMKAICGEDADFIYTDEATLSYYRAVTMKHYKPDYAIDTLRSCNYIGHFTVFSRKIVEQAGAFRKEFNGSHDYDLIFRYTSIASKVYHIQKLLYFRRSRRKKLHDVSSGKKAVRDHLKTQGISARVENKFGLPGFYRVIYELAEKPRVSIIIPNKDHVPLLRNCLSSIIEKTTYTNYEIIIVENNSTKETTFEYYKYIQRFPNIKVVQWKGKGFNYSEICNFGVQHASGKQLVFMNNDVMIITPNWIEEMLMYSQRGDVGIVGIKLYFLNGTVQHAGVVLGMEGICGYVFYGAPHNAIGYMAKLQIVQNLSSVITACIMIKRSVFEEAGLFDPAFPNSFNDIDLCLKVRKAGRLVVWTPYAEAYHLESRSRGYNMTSKKSDLIALETEKFKTKWGKEIAEGDPYYNSNLSLDSEDYSDKLDWLVD
jgi:glycosyltransferase involved in cell wall biosynthesis